jgi:hypothetical protein
MELVVLRVGVHGIASFPSGALCYKADESADESKK